MKSTRLRKYLLKKKTVRKPIFKDTVFHLRAASDLVAEYYAIYRQIEEIKHQKEREASDMKKCIVT